MLRKLLANDKVSLVELIKFQREKASTLISMNYYIFSRTKAGKTN